MQHLSKFQALGTPALLLDFDRMEANIARLKARLHTLGVQFRPHLKTAKCVEVAKLLVDSPSAPITVSTLKEAEQFAEAGYTDILYAVGIVPAKLDRVRDLVAKGVNVKIILDSVDQAKSVVDFITLSGTPISALIEIDCDGHRSGVGPLDSKTILRIAEILCTGTCLSGVMTHAGDSYWKKNKEDIIAAAEKERDSVVQAATILRDAGYECPIVSVGSTPTAHFAQNLDGVTEVRAGVFVFFDLVMAGIGVCGLDDIALSVLTCVIGHQDEKGWIIVDAGWMAMSRDRGTANQSIDQGYGIACDENGKVIEGLKMISANQEHGVVAFEKAGTDISKQFPVGSYLRIFPNHACATAAQYDRYHLIRSGILSETWERFGGW